MRRWRRAPTTWHSCAPQCKSGRLSIKQHIIRHAPGHDYCMNCVMNCVVSALESMIWFPFFNHQQCFVAEQSAARCRCNSRQMCWRCSTVCATALRPSESNWLSFAASRLVQAVHAAERAHLLKLTQ